MIRRRVFRMFAFERIDLDRLGEMLDKSERARELAEELECVHARWMMRCTAEHLRGQAEAHVRARTEGVA